MQGEVNTSKVGLYEIVWSVEDSDGWKDSLKRNVFVSECSDYNPLNGQCEGMKPLIVLTGNNPQIIVLGSSYSELGAKAYDGEEGEITSEIVVKSDVNTSKEGTYTVTYSVTDRDDNTVTIERTVKVEYQCQNINPITGVCEDTEDNQYECKTYNPITGECSDPKSSIKITLVGSNPYTVALHSEYVDPGVKAKDGNGEDITAEVMIRSDVNISREGNYTVEYIVRDSERNSMVSVKRIVEVAYQSSCKNVNPITGSCEDLDTEVVVRPIITLLDESPYFIWSHSGKYVDPGAEAVDDNGTDISDSLVMKGDVDTNSSGEYEIEWVAYDDYGLKGSVKRTVFVIECALVNPVDGRCEENGDMPPYIKLIGNSDEKIELNSEYYDKGAVAYDSEDGNITDNIIIENDVDTSEEGTYTIIYSITDSDDHTVTLERIVKVVYYECKNVNPVTGVCEE